MRRVLSMVSVVVVAGGFLGACSSSGSSGKAADGGANTVALHEGLFVHADAVDAKAGKVTFTVDNAGDVEHNLTIPDLDVDKDVEDGKTVSVTADAKAGTYAFHCEYHPTKMKGTITIGS